MTKCIQQFLLLASFLGLCNYCLQGYESKPNVIFILADDLGYGDIEGRFCIRQGYEKLLLQNLGSEKEQLCQLKEDRSEITNLARNYPDKVKNLIPGWTNRPLIGEVSRLLPKKILPRLIFGRAQGSK